jgi:hypothetical protein
LAANPGTTLDYETLANPTVTIRTTDSGGLSFDKTFTLSVPDVHEKPTEISLDNTNFTKIVAEAVVSTLTIPRVETSTPLANSSFYPGWQ